MNIKDLRLLLLLGLLALSNLASDGLGGFLTGADPGCDCEEEQTVAVTLSSAKLNLVQGETGTTTAEFRVGSQAKAAQWTGDKPSTRLFKASSYSASSGTSTVLSVTAADSVIPEENWDQGTFSLSDSPKIRATGSGGEGEASAVVSLSVWGTQLYWANEDGSVRRWWDAAGDQVGATFNPYSSGGQAKTTLSDGGDSVAYYLKVNVPGGINENDWEVRVIPKPVQRLTMVDHLIPFYDPYQSTHQPSEYIETPGVSVNNGVIKIDFKTKGEFPGSAVGSGSSEMPYEVEVRRKSDGLTVRQQSSLSFYDRYLNL